MKQFNEYDHNKIETIATKFTEGEFVNHKEMKLWYAYKEAVQFFISDEAYWENHSKKETNETVQSIIADIQKAKEELTWIRSIVTFPLQEFCEYYCKRNYEDETRMAYVMAQRVINGTTEQENQFIREMFEESTHLNSINHFRKLKTPVNLRNWTLSLNHATEYHPFETARDCTQLYDSREHYVYIHSKCTQHRWGDTYWISVDCDNSLGSLPVIKDFKNYKFEVGKFYKITCVDEIHFGGNKKKYVMEIEESTEQEFMEKGFEQYITRW